MGKKQKKQELVTGKDHAKFNKRQRFYSKFLRKCNSLSEKEELDSIIPLTMNKKFIFPEYDDLSLLLLEHVSEGEVDEEESVSADNTTFSKDGNLEIPFIDDGYFLIEKIKSKELELICQETFEDEEGNVRKGSGSGTGNDDYNYQSAYNFGIRILEADKLSKTLEKEAETPTEYEIEVKTKTIDRRRHYHRPHKPFFTRRRRR